MGKNRVGIEVTGDQIMAAIRDLPNVGQGDKDKDSPSVTGAVSKDVQGAGLTEGYRPRIGVS